MNVGSRCVPRAPRVPASDIDSVPNLAGKQGQQGVELGCVQEQCLEDSVQTIVVFELGCVREHCLEDIDNPLNIVVKQNHANKFTMKLYCF